MANNNVQEQKNTEVAGETQHPWRKESESTFRVHDSSSELANRNVQEQSDNAIEADGTYLKSLKMQLQLQQKMIHEDKGNPSEHLPNADLSMEVEEVTFLNKPRKMEEPSVKTHRCWQKLRKCCPCPPQGILASVITKVVMVVLLWATIWSITGAECLPGGNLFGNLILFVSAVVGGKIVGLIKFPNLPPLPPLLGMLLAGFLLRNIPVVSDAVYIKQTWSSALRSIALAIILTRAGLGLDPKALMKLKAVCIRLAFGPCILETGAVCILAYFLLQMPWSWGFILGFVLAAVSPAVVVPSMLILQGEGFGVDKGIPTLLMAAGSFDDILAITGFNTCLGIAFSSGSMVTNIIRGFLEVVLGIVAGAIIGFILRYIPSKDQDNLLMKRFYLLLGVCVFAIFAATAFGFPGSGGLCIIVIAFLAGNGWVGGKSEIEELTDSAWSIFQPFLFGLIGAEISVASLELTTVGLGIATLSIALVFRIFVTFFMVLCAGFNMKEKIFVSLAWIPKATVQAAIGSTALDTARMRNDKTSEVYGMTILTVAFLAILLTAPVGAIIISLTGPRFLQKSNQMAPVNRDGGTDEYQDVPLDENSQELEDVI